MSESIGEYVLAPDWDGILWLEPADNYSIPTYDPMGAPFTDVDRMYVNALRAIYDHEADLEEE